MAEGIETAEQLAVVRDLGISAGQGYLLGRPGKEPVAEQIDLAGLTSLDHLPLMAIMDRLDPNRAAVTTLDG